MIICFIEIERSSVYVSIVMILLLPGAGLLMLILLGIELPAKRKPTPAKKSSAPKTKASTPKTKPATAKTKRSSPKKKETVIPSESTPSEPPAPSISFQVNDDGVPVFVIPLPQPTVQEEPTKGKGSRKNRKDDLSSTTITKRSLKMLMDSRGGANALSKSPPSKKHSDLFLFAFSF